ncbi:unnamed protein product [Dimorphilus gyrociliatus]|uniref:Uncharacterized protein n=1 Tax=Dimorphilus gyrociliatus TaxID=2664684 RepID=A0A7I8WBJ9_9ANNE|nr:unnamed protein product [Dimorphilus gyrociliatus]
MNSINELTKEFNDRLTTKQGSFRILKTSKSSENLKNEDVVNLEGVTLCSVQKIFRQRSLTDPNLKRTGKRTDKNPKKETNDYQSQSPSYAYRLACDDHIHFRPRSKTCPESLRKRRMKPRPATPPPLFRKSNNLSQKLDEISQRHMPELPEGNRSPSD